MRTSIFCAVALMFCAVVVFGEGDNFALKPSPEKALQSLKDGNKRFVSGKTERPRMTLERIRQADKESQAKHAVATVLSCSDSRVPVELIFDQGIMDLFVVRVAGNVCNTDEAGSIEYGLRHVNTPVLVVLGHTQCGAVTAVAQSVDGHGHKLEKNIPPLVGSIGPAVKKAQEKNPGRKAGDLVPQCVEENVWTAMENLFLKSAAVREIVRGGKVRVVGAIYDLGDGSVKWLPEAKVSELLEKAEKNPARSTEAMAE